MVTGTLPARRPAPRWWSGYVHVLERIVGALLMGVIALTFTNVVRRALGLGVFPFADELARRMLVWLTFFGAALAIIRASHLRIDALIEAAPPRVARGLQVVVGALSIVFFMLLIVEGGAFARSTMDRVTPSMNVSAAWTTGILPVGGVLMLTSYLGRLRFGPAQPLLGDDGPEDLTIPSQDDAEPADGDR